jgi:hypothetical protein
MRAQTVLAATNERQPDTGFTGHWNQAIAYQIPLDHKCFDELVCFISQFENLLTS